LGWRSQARNTSARLHSLVRYGLVFPLRLTTFSRTATLTHARTFASQGLPTFGYLRTILNVLDVPGTSLILGCRQRRQRRTDVSRVSQSPLTLYRLERS
jgi:hypothetical protein